MTFAEPSNTCRDGPVSRRRRPQSPEETSSVGSIKRPVLSEKAGKVKFATSYEGVTMSRRPTRPPGPQEAMVVIEQRRIAPADQSFWTIKDEPPLPIPSIRMRTSWLQRADKIVASERSMAKTRARHQRQGNPLAVGQCRRTLRGRRPKDAAEIFSKIGGIVDFGASVRGPTMHSHQDSADQASKRKTPHPDLANKSLSSRALPSRKRPAVN